MNTKDWLMIIIPIVSNGIILYFFQLIISLRMEKSKRNNSYKLEVLKEFHNILQDLYISTRNFSSLDSTRSGQEFKFAELWNPIAENKEKLIVFISSHPAVIDETLGISEFKEHYDDMVSVAYNSRINNNNIIDEQTMHIFIEEYNELLSIIQRCMNNYENEILKIV